MIPSLIVAAILLSFAFAYAMARRARKRRHLAQVQGELAIVVQRFMKPRKDGRPSTRKEWQTAATKARRARLISAATYVAVMRDPKPR